MKRYLLILLLPLVSIASDYEVGERFPNEIAWCKDKVDAKSLFDVIYYYRVSGQSQVAAENASIVFDALVDGERCEMGTNKVLSVVDKASEKSDEYEFFWIGTEDRGVMWWAYIGRQIKLDPNT